MLYPFLHIYAFMVWANSVDPDQRAQLCQVISDQKANSADPYLTARMCRLILI
jgi:hypothetical protein